MAQVDPNYLMDYDDLYQFLKYAKSLDASVLKSKDFQVGDIKTGRKITLTKRSISILLRDLREMQKQERSRR